MADNKYYSEDQDPQTLSRDAKDSNNDHELPTLSGVEYPKDTAEVTNEDLHVAGEYTVSKRYVTPLPTLTTQVSRGSRPLVLSWARRPALLPSSVSFFLPMPSVSTV